MSRQTVEREISRLDAISRTRALDSGETMQLSKLIRTERAYKRARDARPKPHSPGAVSDATSTQRSLSATQAPTADGAPSGESFVLPTSGGASTHQAVGA